MEIHEGALYAELTFKTSRSGGKGGQHVNKVSSKVELDFDVRASALFSPAEKELIFSRLAARINSAGILQVFSEKDRSQFRNRENSFRKLIVLLTRALHQEKPRKSTRPGRSAVEKRLSSKRIQSLKKISRGKHFD